MTDRQLVLHHWHLPDRVLSIGRRPLVMGIINVTPDSFSDGGRYAMPPAAIAHALELVQQGADILDIGGESTRPGSQPVPLEEELRRVLPVVEGLAGRVSVPLSIDTSKAEVARRCLQAGAHIINDVTALTGDPAMPEVVRAAGAAVVLMHMQGTPATMQDDPHYEDVVREVRQYLEERLQSCAAAGIAAERVAVDPGIGFGKRLKHNLTLLARLEAFQGLGRPVCLGVSRKGFIGRVLGRPDDRRPLGSLAIVCHAMARGAVQIVRVHDVAETSDAVKLLAAIEAA
jgi:dihydropteroate synthase